MELGIEHTSFVVIFLADGGHIVSMVLDNQLLQQKEDVHIVEAKFTSCFCCKS